MSSRQWAEMGDMVYGILHEVYVARPVEYGQHAVRKGITLEQLATAAVAGAIHEHMEAAKAKAERRPRR